MTPNYFNKANQDVPSVTDFQGLSEPKKSLRVHLRSVKRVLSLKRDKPKDDKPDTKPNTDAIKPTQTIDYNELIVEAGPVRKASIDVQGEMILRTANSRLGLAIVSHAEASTLGEVRDLIFCHETDEVLALILENQKSELGDVQIVPWSEICRVGKEKITVYRAVSKMNLRDYPRALHAATDGQNRLSGTQILNSEGQYLRMLSDMCIDESSGCIVGYETSGGFIADTLQGKTFR